MELIQIGADKLKVMLTEEDMKHYEIEFDLLDYGNTETRRAIWSILDEAKRRIGFDAARDKVYIQVFKGISGGCELFVSRVEPLGNEAQRTRRLLFRFENAENMIAACRRLENCRFSGASTAFSGDDGKMYLCLEAAVQPCGKPDALSFIEEFGTKLPYRAEYLSEHAALVCHGAVSALSDLK